MLLKNINFGLKGFNTEVSLEKVRKNLMLNGACSPEFINYVMDNLYLVEPGRLTSSVRVVKDKYSDLNYKYTYIRLDKKRILTFIKYGSNVSVEYDLDIFTLLSKSYA